MAELWGTQVLGEGAGKLGCCFERLRCPALWEPPERDEMHLTSHREVQCKAAAGGWAGEEYAQGG